MMNLLKACYDWRVVTALGAVGVGVFVLAPTLIVAALPLLLVAACPLSMMVMMKTMSGHEASADLAPSAISGDRAEQIQAELAASRREQQRLMDQLDELRGQPSAPVPRAIGSSPLA